MKATLIFLVILLGCGIFLSKCTVLLETEGEYEFLFARMNESAWVMDGATLEDSYFLINEVDGQSPRRKARSISGFLPLVMLSPGRHELSIWKKKTAPGDHSVEQLSLAVEVRAGTHYLLVWEGEDLRLLESSDELLFLANQPLQRTR